MVTNEIILSDEIADYPNHMLLSDFGGIFGFFVGITMLTFVSCLKKIYWYTIRVSSILKVIFHPALISPQLIGNRCWGQKLVTIIGFDLSF